jgi:hypothetical protein
MIPKLYENHNSSYMMSENFAKLPWQRQSAREISACNVVPITKEHHSTMAIFTFFQQTFHDNL